MSYLITGSSGLIGSALVKRLRSAGTEVVTLGRGAQATYKWGTGYTVLPGVCRGVANVVHLAGAGIADGRWTPARRKEIWDSRVLGTRGLVDAVKGSEVKTIVSASGVGFYGDRGDEALTESAGKGQGFLGDLAAAWEEEALRAKAFGIRVVVLRLGVVISRQGGLLGRIYPIFRLGFGGRLGSGRQFFSWVSLDDVLNAIQFVIEAPALNGPCNLVSPGVVTNQEFTAALANFVKRPAIFGVPEWAVRLIFGEMGQELMLSSQRAVPEKLLSAGFRFMHPSIRSVLEVG